MFSGIGGFREGLTRAGGFTCVGHCEIDEYANRSYNALFDTKGEWFIEDARKADPSTIRRLTPRECLRLQGWADDRIDTVLAIQSDNQAYKQAGNGVTVNVVEAIGRRIAKMDAELRGETPAP